MIVIDKYDEIVSFALSVKDEKPKPTTIRFTNIQSRQSFEIGLVDVSTTQRTAVYNVVLVADLENFEQTFGTIIRDFLVGSGYSIQGDRTYLYLAEGTYDYKIGGEIGLAKIGYCDNKPTVFQTTDNNDIYYN